MTLADNCNFLSLGLACTGVGLGLAFFKACNAFFSGVDVTAADRRFLLFGRGFTRACFWMGFE